MCSFSGACSSQTIRSFTELSAKDAASIAETTPDNGGNMNSYSAAFANSVSPEHAVAGFPAMAAAEFVTHSMTKTQYQASWASVVA